MDVTMPQLGETVTEGTITRWFKQVGETIAVDEPLFEVSTDKVDSEVPAPAAGVVSEILVPEGDTVPVGARLAVISDSVAAEPAAPAPAPEAPAATEPEPAPPVAATPPPSPISAPPPPVGSGATPPPAPPAPEPAVAREPAPVREPAPAPAPSRDPAPVAGATDPAPVAGATDPATVGSNGGGVVTSPLVRRMIAEQGLDPSQIHGTGEGGRITRNDVVEASRGHAAAPAAPAPAVEEPAADETPAEESVAADAAPTLQPSKPAAWSSPPASRGAETDDVPHIAEPPASEVAFEPPAPVETPAPAPAPVAEAPAPAPVEASATPPAPVAAAAPAPAAAAEAEPDDAPVGADEIVPFDNIRRRTAEHMVRSKATSAHVYTSVRVDFERIERVRKTHQAEWKREEGFSLTYLPFIVRALCDVVHDYPHVNASVDGQSLVVHHRLHLGVAVDLDFNGLVAPVIRNADGKRLRLVAREVRDLAARAKSKQLGPDEVVGGTFTITNMGPFGTTMTLPIINQPQVAIMATDGIRKEPVVVEGRDGEDSIAIHHVGALVLAWDHRAFDGAYAASFLNEVRTVLETRDWEAELRVSERRESPLRVRWLGLVPYREAEALQRAVHERAVDDYLLLQEHPHVYTLGSSANPAHVLRDPAAVGAELVHADRGGDVTYHGPGQLVGYPIISLAEWRAGQRDVVAYVRRLESVLVAALADFGIEASCSPGYTGVWVGDEKIGAIGVRVACGRTRHGFALNVDPDLEMFGHIVPCGIHDRGVTSMAKVLGTAPKMRAVVDRVVARFAESFESGVVERQDVAWRTVTEDLAPFTRAADVGVPVRLLGRLADAGVREEVDPAARRPEWMKVRARFDEEYLGLKKLVRDLDLHTVCEETGCPNIYECWADRTATFMILGDRCTRACGFCQVDTRKPLAVDADEPRRVADAVHALGLAHVVITCVARDDLPDGGASVFAATVDAVRAENPDTAVELLIADCKGDDASLATIFAARPDVLNHNLETVARLQRAARPSAGYARSLAVLGRAKDAGLVTKSGLILGMGETADEVRSALADLRAVGVDIVTLGQYLRPSAQHLPVARWWTPDEFDAVRVDAEAMGFRHVEAGPLVRSSYHARAGVDHMVGAPS